MLKCVSGGDIYAGSGGFYTGGTSRNVLCKRTNFVNREVRLMVENIDDVVSTIDYAISTRRKKHIMGGLLMSVALLFGGLAFTVFTIKSEESGKDNDIYEEL